MGQIPNFGAPPPDSSLTVSGKAADAKVVGDKIDLLSSRIATLEDAVGDKFNNLPQGLQYLGSISSGETFQLEAYRVYLGVYYHPVHSVCIGMYLLHRGTAVQSDTNVVPIVSNGHVTALSIDSSNILHLSTDSWGGNICIYKFMNM